MVKRKYVEFFCYNTNLNRSLFTEFVLVSMEWERENIKSFPFKSISLFVRFVVSG